ncbi:MAG: hypothetical protein AMDU2_EPLC00007G0013 [Thermoplasmatales archaeon E-plasma]|nr:MAG: hypothetical protein AMDU2_EPLC00007G0013 [Thermoplasmatales archaeon E-plasma]
MIKNPFTTKILVIVVIIAFIFIEIAAGIGANNNIIKVSEKGNDMVPDLTGGKIIVYFNESGLGTGLGRTWSVNINGINYASTNRTIIFTGTGNTQYDYYIHSIQCAATTNSSGSFNSNATFHIHFYLKPQSNPLKVPERIVSYVPIAIDNNQVSSTPDNFTEYIVVNSSLYANYENRNLTNVEFFNSTGGIIPSWLESGNSPQSDSTIYWLRLNNSIHGQSSYFVYMGFSNRGVQLMNGIWTGESPSLTSSYGSLDDGYHVFSYYYNFSGTVINTGQWILNQSSNIQQYNGIGGKFNGSGGYLASRVHVPSGYMVNEFVASCGDGDDFGFLNTTEEPVYMGYNVSQGIYIRLASVKTYPDMINKTMDEQNPSGNSYGSFVNNENTVGTYTVETLNKSSTFDFLNYGVGNTSQPITGMNENYPMSFGINGRGTGFEIRWISVSRTPPDYVMPYNFAANESENISRSAMSFVAKGISDNVQWGIYINNQLFQSSSRSIILYLTNGHYSFYVKDNPSYSIFYNFNGISVSGANETYYIQFVPETYSLIFNEAGLSGESWYVQLLNGQNFSIASNHLLYISASAYAGKNYSFSIGTDVEGEIPVLNNTPLISGSNYELTVKFQKPYNITFVERGLVANSTWYLNISKVGSYSSSSGKNITIPLINGTYNFTIGTTYKILHSPGGKITVNGFPFIRYVNFTDFNYTVNFFEKNLSNGMWSVNVSALWFKESGFGTNISFYLTNGTYNYNASSSNRSFIGQTGTFTINGSNESVYIEFHELFTVNFFKVNLPSSSVWTVIINKTKQTGAGVNLTFHEINGSYAFHAYTSNLNFSTNYTQYFTVKGRNFKINVTFAQAYNVTFQETGLGSGKWYVNLSTELSANASSGLKIILHLINGKYNFTVQTSNKTFRAEYLPHFTVNSRSMNVNVTFKIVKFNVTFMEADLSSGVWFVNLTDNSNSGAIAPGGNFTFALTNGTYSYSVETSYKKEKAEYYPSFEVNGSKLNITINFYAVNFTFYYNIIYELYHNSKNPNQLFPGSQMPWHLNIRSTTGSFSQIFNSDSSEINISLQNGTYSYTLNYPYNIFNITNASGTFIINGSNLHMYSNVNVTYYKLIIHETGLSNVEWGAAIQLSGSLSNYFPVNLNESTSNNTIVSYLFNGTYSINFGLYSLKSPASYTFLKSVSYSMSGEFNHTYELNISLTLPPGPESIAPAGFISLIGSENFILPLALILLITIIIVPVVRGRYPGEP